MSTSSTCLTQDEPQVVVTSAVRVAAVLNALHTSWTRDAAHEASLLSLLAGAGVDGTAIVVARLVDDVYVADGATECVLRVSAQDGVTLRAIAERLESSAAGRLMEFQYADSRLSAFEEAQRVACDAAVAAARGLLGELRQAAVLGELGEAAVSASRGEVPGSTDTVVCVCTAQDVYTVVDGLASVAAAESLRARALIADALPAVLRDLAGTLSPAALFVRPASAVTLTMSGEALASVVRVVSVERAVALQGRVSDAPDVWVKAMVRMAVALRDATVSDAPAA